MRKKRLFGIKEKLVKDILENQFLGTNYKILSKVRLCDVITRDQDEKLAKEDYNFLRTAHFDFVIYPNEDNAEAIFVVEFDDVYHQTDPEQRLRDIRKNRLCHRAELNLIRIDDKALEEHDKATILEFMISRFLAWQKDERKIFDAINKYISSLKQSEVDRLVANGDIDLSLDPGFIFDLSYPFPGILRIAKRLYDKYEIYSDYLRNPNIRKKHFKKEYPLVCKVCPWGFDASHYYYKATVSFLVYIEKQPIKDRKWIHGALLNSKKEILLQDKINFSMQSTLPIEEDYDPSKGAFDYLIKKEKIPVMLVQVPGIEIHSITDWFCQYLALKEIEKWAFKNLKKVKNEIDRKNQSL